MSGRWNEPPLRIVPWGLWIVFIGLPILSAQRSVNAVQRLLPVKAKVIETADVTAIAGKARMMVLWMDHAEVHNTGEEYCGTSVHGSDVYVGPTRLSLVDSATPRLINTVKILGRGSDGQGTEDSFLLPALVSNDYYYVPHLNSSGRGVPQILHLQDLTGSGTAAEFVLFMYDACGIASTSVLGYQTRSDRVVQYHVQVNGAGTDLWVEQVFATKPVAPGHWNFSWGPGHGSDDIIHEDVRFDRNKQMFVDTQTVSQPEPGGK
jgi:hypothetical protein